MMEIDDSALGTVYTPANVRAWARAHGLAKYSPDQPRDERGRWSETGAEGVNARDAQVQSPAFKAWFKGSKAVDKNGRPIVLYHATTQSFGEFETHVSEMGAHFGTKAQIEDIESTVVLPVYVSVHNPIRLEDQGHFSAQTIADQLVRQKILTEEEAAPYLGRVTGRPVTNASLQFILREKGYDGIVYLNRREGYGRNAMTWADAELHPEWSDRQWRQAHPEASDSWVVFSPEQVKSATGNVGTFNPENSDITKGGPGSGHFGHEGRPGEVGGSAPSGVAVAESDVLTPQAEAHLDALEQQALQSAVHVSDEEEEEGNNSTWDDLPQHVKDEVFEHWQEGAFEDALNDLDTSGIDDDYMRDLRRDNEDYVDAAVKDLEKFRFQEAGTTLPLGDEGFHIIHTLDPNTIEVDDDDTGDGISVDTSALRFKGGDRLTPEQRDQVQDFFQNSYNDAIHKAFDNRYDDASYQDAESELESEAVQQQWDDMSDTDKVGLIHEYGIDYEPTVAERGPVSEPSTWHTGLNPQGNTSDRNYQATRAIVNTMVELRAKELDPDVNEAEIRETWESWKASSHSDESLAFQLAAAEALPSGVHRLNTDEVARAESAVGGTYGMHKLRAVAQAQYEVTQWLLQKAGVDRVTVYRAIGLPKEEVESAQKEIVAGPHSETYRLPGVQLKRSGLQSTTTDRYVANGWSAGGYGAQRVVLRIRAPRTSVFSVPVFGRNIHAEHEVVLRGSRDPWQWDVWPFAAPDFGDVPLTKSMAKARTPKKPLVIDLQHIDIGKPHWLRETDPAAARGIARRREQRRRVRKGGKGSGNFGHAGRPGEVGGSGPGSGRLSVNRNALEHRAETVTLYHSGTGKPDFDAYFGTEQFRQTFPDEFGARLYAIQVPPDFRVLNLNERNAATNEFKARLAEQAWPKDTAYASQLRAGTADEQDVYEAWTDKQQVMAVLNQTTGLDAVRYQDEYLIPQDRLRALKGTLVKSRPRGTQVRVKKSRFLHLVLNACGLLKYSPDQPRDDQGRWTDGGGSSVATNPNDKASWYRQGGSWQRSPEGEEPFGWKEKQADPNYEPPTVQHDVVKDGGLWGSSHGASKMIASVSADEMGIAGYEGFASLNADPGVVRTANRFLTAIADDAVGSEETLYHSFENTAKTNFKVGDTLRLPLTAAAGSPEAYGVRLDYENQTGQPTYFVFPRGTQMAAYDTMTKADARELGHATVQEAYKEFGRVWDEAIVAGGFEVTKVETRYMGSQHRVTPIRSDAEIPQIYGKVVYLKQTEAFVPGQGWRTRG